MSENLEQFPSGKLVPTDEGQLEVRMGVMEPGGTATERTLIVDFGKNVSWVGFTKQTGTAFAEQFLKRLSEL